jgi:lysozyme family protein
MVKKIIQIIDQNTDQTPNNFPIGSTLYEEASMNFASALHKLKELCQKNEWSIPDKLSCLDKLPKGTLREILDEYVKDRAPFQR